MAKSLWLNDGKLVRSGGTLCLNDDCPCGPPTVECTPCVDGIGPAQFRVVISGYVGTCGVNYNGTYILDYDFGDVESGTYCQWSVEIPDTRSMPPDAFGGAGCNCTPTGTTTMYLQMGLASGGLTRFIRVQFLLHDSTGLPAPAIWFENSGPTGSFFVDCARLEDYAMTFFPTAPSGTEGDRLCSSTFGFPPYVWMMGSGTTGKYTGNNPTCLVSAVV